jgi:hypothetical protein
MDFASHRGFTGAVWAGDALRGRTSVYTLGAHVDATERWTGVPTRIALPFGYSPTMLWVLGPLCLVPARAAFAAWSLAGVLAIAAAAARARLAWYALLALVSPLAVYALALGQTAILSTAGLVFLMAVDRDDRRPSPWASGVVLWLATAKPPVAITAAAVLLVRRRWRPLAVAGLLTVASTIAVLPWLGPGIRTAGCGTYDRPSPAGVCLVDRPR